MVGLQPIRNSGQWLAASTNKDRTLGPRISPGGFRLPRLIGNPHSERGLGRTDSHANTLATPPNSFISRASQQLGSTGKLMPPKSPGAFLCRNRQCVRPHHRRDAAAGGPPTSWFSQGLQERGWSIGRNLQIDYRWAAGDAERSRTLAVELIALAPDVILGPGGSVVGPLQRATRTIPIICVQVSDPVGAGYADSLRSRVSCRSCCRQSSSS